MSWQSKIYHKYRFNEKGVKIVSDYTGLLIHASFLHFLDEEKKPYSVVQTIPEILKKLNSNELIILGKSLSIPTFINNQSEVFNFNFSDLPINGSAEILSGISVEKIISLLEYLDENQPHFVISVYNLQNILEVSNEYAARKSLNSLNCKIQSNFNKPLSIENVISIAQEWSVLQYNSYQLNNTEYLGLINQIDNYCNSYFIDGTWQEAFFAQASNPKTIDKILNKLKFDKAPQKALLCFDCMGLPEWLLLKNFLNDLNLTFEESPVFSLIPSITSIARSAIFAGTYDVYEKKNPGQAIEEIDFKEFFGIENTLYLKEKDFTDTDLLIGYNTVSILFNFFDDLSHSTLLQENNPTKFSYFNASNDYLKNSRVKQIIKDLLEQGFTIYICSDHGSTIACGNGNRVDKYLIDKFAKRATIISKDSAVLTEYKKVSIPFIENKLVIIPENREMFANRNQYEINHGGITIEEMVVPFIKIIK